MADETAGAAPATPPTSTDDPFRTEVAQRLDRLEGERRGDAKLLKKILDRLPADADSPLTVLG